MVLKVYDCNCIVFVKRAQVRALRIIPAQRLFRASKHWPGKQQLICMIVFSASIIVDLSTVLKHF